MVSLIKVGKEKYQRNNQENQKIKHSLSVVQSVIIIIWSDLYVVKKIYSLKILKGKDNIKIIEFQQVHSW